MQTNSATYSLLLSPRYRMLRYALLCFMMFLFSYSETLYHYPHAESLPFYLFTLTGFLCKLVLSVLLISILIPLLLRRKYVLFWAFTLTLIIAFVWLQQIVLENLISHCFHILPWRENVHPLHIWMDILAQNALWLMVLLGVLMGRMLRYWNDEHENKLQIEASKIQMETESMKEQVSSSLLCSTLRKSGYLAEVNPKETSGILMQLSRLLRYQLYDCRQEKVLLESEIKFLKEYLAILRYNNGCAGFNISVSGGTMSVLISPMLFVPFLQSEDSWDKDAFIDIGFHVENDCLTFELTDNCMQRNEESIRNCLEQLYPQKYQLDIQPKHVLLNIQIR